MRVKSAYCRRVAALISEPEQQAKGQQPPRSSLAIVASLRRQTAKPSETSRQDAPGAIPPLVGTTKTRKRKNALSVPLARSGDGLERRAELPGKFWRGIAKNIARIVLPF